MNQVLTEKETVGIFKSGKNKKVIELLKKQNKNVVEFPLLKNEAVLFEKVQETVLENIREFDWLVFTDIFSVGYFLDELEKTGFELFELDNFRICACGEAVADKLRFVQIHSDVIPHERSAEKIIAAISEYIFDDSEFLNSNILIIKAENKYFEISELLIERQIKNVEMEVYRVLPGNGLEHAKLNVLLSGGAIDRFIFTSAEDVESLINISEKLILTDILSGIEIEATDEITLQTLSENNL